MLARTFMTAEELSISKSLHGYLTKLYWMLKDGQVPAPLFSMRQIGCIEIDAKGRASGEPGCYIGWCRALGMGHETIPSALHALFWPYHARAAWGASPKQAAQALHCYLTTGRDGWSEAAPAPKAAQGDTVGDTIMLRLVQHIDCDYRCTVPIIRAFSQVISTYPPG